MIIINEYCWFAKWVLQNDAVGEWAGRGKVDECGDGGSSDAAGSKGKL